MHDVSSREHALARRHPVRPLARDDIPLRVHLNSRRGRIEGMEARANAQSIRAFVPLAEMFGYATDLRSKTQGRGNYSMEFDHYEDVPRSISEAIVAKLKG